MEKKFFCSCFCIVMSSPTPSDISQNDTEMLEEQCYEMQQWHEDVESKYKEIAARDEEKQRLSKKSRRKQPGKYCWGAAVNMGGANTCERCMCARQDCLVHFSRWVIFIILIIIMIILIIFSFIANPSYVPDASPLSSGVYPTPTPTPQPWSPLMAEF